ncbi:MAG: tRNA glutamyl-Q(34) synthetase GluQRS [Alphaproteobacteria bacterium]|nr:tRNA glutamyl-Q(34) synthetase GluQRS [Alphaproteobacteria bacterium]
MTPQSQTTRFAPSPTGYLHLGHAFSALFAHEAAKKSGGRFILRIEDIDPVRCRPEFETAIYEDLAWLGLEWETPVRRQSEHLAEYRTALDRLDEMGLLYPCFCTRKDIAGEIERSGHAPHGPDGLLYPKICRAMGQAEQDERMGQGQPYALRLDMAKAQRLAGQLTWRDLVWGERRAEPDRFGDVVLARKDVPASYHLAVTLDDHLQGVTLVTRGEDLFEASHLHRLLQFLLSLDVPLWQHHALLMGPSGQRLAKRDKAETIRSLRERGFSADEVRRLAQSQKNR